MDPSKPRFPPSGPKDTWAETAREIVTGERVIPAEELEGLLCWLQDVNWPGSAEIGTYIGTLSDRLRSQIECVLNGPDLEWRYSLLCSMCSWKAEQLRPFATQLRRVVIRQQSADEVEYEFASIALECLWRSRMIDRSEALGLVEMLRARSIVSEESAAELEGMLAPAE